MSDKTVTSLGKKMIREHGDDRASANSEASDGALRVPASTVDLASLEEVLKPKRTEGRGATLPTPSFDRRTGSVGVLLKQIGSVKFLSSHEERQVARVLQTYRNEFREIPFSFMPVARNALELISEAVVEGVKQHHSRILHITTIDSEADKQIVLDQVRLNIKTAGLLMERCGERWASQPAGISASEMDKTVEAILRDQRKIGVLLSEVAIRPAFISSFLSDFQGFVATVRSYQKEVLEAPDASVQRQKEAILHQHLFDAQETCEFLIEKSERLVRAHEVYVAAKQILVTRNLPLAVSVAKKFSNNGVPLEDLFQ